MFKKIFNRKSLVVLLAFSAFILGPTIGAQMINPIADVRMDAISPSKYILNNDHSIYKLLVIAPKKFVKVLQPLVTHKNSVGISTELVTLTEVYDQMYWHGRDEAEKIKYFIKTAIEDWGIKYVLLVGDFRLMPVRYCYNADVNSGFNEPCFISELYYADIYDAEGNFSSWDTNNNGIYGEWFGDVAEDSDIDLYPDVYVGRLACRNKIEVKIMVKKIITYEKNTYGKEWFNKIVVVAGDTYPESINPNWTGNEGEENTLRVLENMTGFESVKLWTSDGSFTGTRDVLYAVNKGCGFLYFDGHSNPFRWSTHPPNDKDTWIEGLSVLSMSRLRNRNMLPICVVGGCHNLQFDVHLGKLREDPFYYFTWISECWGWKLTRKIGGGSIATIGCTGLGMTKEDKESFSGAGDFLEPTFFYEYGTNGTHILGEAWGKTISDYLNEYPIDWETPAAWDYAIDAKTVQQWALLGDPSLQIGGYLR
ncbi:MAG: hypothetical protein KAJ44_03450 [Thermoplasmatales archaeon]|nr:hypothetical protein [Thermoplasmatales archaeon]